MKMTEEFIDLKYVTRKREPFFEIAREYIRQDSKVLDIGAGDGYFSEYCKRDDFCLYDGNEKSVVSLKSKYPNSYYGRLPDLPFEDRCFDVIHCSHVIEHLSPETLYLSLKEIDRCLKDGGYLIISTPLLWENFYTDLSHVKPYYPLVFIKYLTKGENQILSRERIAHNYTVQRLQYRFREIPIKGSLYNIKKNVFIQCLLFFLKILRLLGLSRYEKTGYTIVLCK